MSISLLFAAGDVGGARALIPIIEFAASVGHDVFTLRHSYLAQNADLTTSWIDPPDADNTEQQEKLIKGINPDVMIFGSSLKDSLPLAFARAAQRLGIKVIHVLDSWAAYTLRMNIDNRGSFVPDIYTAMDQIAVDAAVREGIFPQSLRITGQPSLSNMLERYSEVYSTQRADQKPDKLRLLFISEPASSDQGVSAEDATYRGYTEIEVLELLCNALQPLWEHVFISILPHPRENPKSVGAVWERSRGKLQGIILPQGLKKAPLETIDAVIGMASILLYECWLLGIPVLSLQPGMIQENLGQFGYRDGLKLIDSYDNAQETIRSWIDSIEPGKLPEPLQEAKVHARAPQRIMDIALELTRNKNQ